MREIKFRAWDNKNNRMSQVFTFVNIHSDHYGCGLGDKKCVKNHYTESGFMKIGETFWLDECEVMQYTGLKDKNGKEIYEGDFLECKGKDYSHRDMIKLDWSKDGEYGFCWVNSEKIKGCGDIIRTQDLIDRRYEVIGNKFENPELLK